MNTEQDLTEETNPIGAAPTSAPDFVGVLLRRKWVVVLGAVAGIALGYLDYIQRPEVFQTAAKVLVVKKRPDVLPIANATSASYFEDFLPTHLVLLKSPVIIGRAVEKGEFRKLGSFATQGDPVGSVINSLSVASDTQNNIHSSSSILNLSIRASVADDCPLILNAIIASYEDFLGDTYQSMSQEVLDLITQAKTELWQDLRDKEAEYKEFRDRAQLLWKGKEGGNIHQERMGAIESARSGILVRRAEIEGRLNALEAAINKGTSKAVLTSLFNRSTGSGAKVDGRYASLSLDEQLFPLLLQQQMLEEDFGPDHPQVRSVKSRIDLTKNFFIQQSDALRKLSSDTNETSDDKTTSPIQIYQESIKQELDENRVVESSLSELFEKERESATRLAKDEAQDEAFRREIDRTQVLLDGIIKRLQEIDLVKDGGYTTQVISPPGAGWKVEPKASRILTIAVFLGAVAGFGLAYLIDISDKSFRSPEEIRRKLGLPVVGHIPFLHDRDTDETNEVVSDQQVDPILCTFHRPKSRDAEAYRGVRTALYFSTRGEGHKVIQITSPCPGDGKTTLACNLAVSIAQSGRKILLIDADFRRPRIHKIFGFDSKVGLASVFLGESDINNAIKQTIIPGLSVLPCGPHPPNPAELLTSQRFKETVDVLREQFDFVVIDTPPLLAVTDPCAVAPRVDGLLLTIRISKHSRTDAERARDILSSLGASVLGVVVNGTGNQPGYGQNHYGYGYGYGYGGYKYGYGYGSYGGYENPHYGYGYYEGDEGEDANQQDVGDTVGTQSPPTSQHKSKYDSEPEGFVQSERKRHHSRHGNSLSRRILHWLRRFWTRV